MDARRPCRVAGRGSPLSLLDRQTEHVGELGQRVRLQGVPNLDPACEVVVRDRRISRGKNLRVEHLVGETLRLGEAGVAHLLVGNGLVDEVSTEAVYRGGLRRARSLGARHALGARRRDP